MDVGRGPEMTLRIPNLFLSSPDGEGHSTVPLGRFKRIDFSGYAEEGVVRALLCPTELPPRC